MVPLPACQASNELITTTLPNLVAVFVGGTSGLGEYALLEFASKAKSPRVYVTGRSQESADRILKECRSRCPSGTFEFIKGDFSLLKEVDRACKIIKEKEEKINVMLLTQGGLKFGNKTEEGLEFGSALITYCRNRFIVNLLPLIKAATGLRRVVTTHTATYEGKVDFDILEGRKQFGLTSIHKMRPLSSSVITLSLESIADTAPSVSFIHDFPGAVMTNIIRGDEAFVIRFFSATARFLTRSSYAMPNEESGARHLFLMTSARYPAKEIVDGNNSGNGIAIGSGVEVAQGTDGKAGSGTYSVDVNCESGKRVEMLKQLRDDGSKKRIWEYGLAKFKEITGSEALA